VCTFSAFGYGVYFEGKIYEIRWKKVMLSLGIINEAPLHVDEWGLGITTPPFLSSMIDGGEWSVSRPYRCTPWETAPVLIL
jgi:hypothetical protein